MVHGRSSDSDPAGSCSIMLMAALLVGYSERRHSDVRSLSTPPRGRERSPSAWAGEKLVLHKLRIHPDLIAPFSTPAKGGSPISPPCEGGVRGGGRVTTSHKVFPCSLPPSPSASLSRCEKNRFRCRRPSHHPPYPPFARGGKGSFARHVTPSRATKTRDSKPSLPLSQYQLLTDRPSACLR